MSRRFRKPDGWPVWRPLGVLAILAATIGGVLYRFGGDTETVDAEARYEGVHLCSSKEAATFTPTASAVRSFTASPSATVSETASATPGEAEQTSAALTGTPTPGAATATPTPTTVADIAGFLGDPGDAAPFFAQNAAAWGADEYDHGRRQDVGCGTSIAQCGCAMTSIGTVLALFDVVRGGDGQDLTPRSLNDWMNVDATLTGAGWASRGFVYGNVIWTVANAYSAEAAAANPDANTVRFSRWGSGSLAEIRADLEQGRPVILEVPGHYIAAVGIDGDDILINDPFYRDRTHLSRSYPGLVRSSRHFEASDDLGALVVTVPANLRVVVRDAQGNVTGTLEGQSPRDAQDAASAGIRDSSYRFEEAWRDPTCSESPPDEDAGTNTVFIPSPGDQTFEIEVVGTGDAPVNVVIHDVDSDGQITVQALAPPAGADDGRIRVAHDTPERRKRTGNDDGTRILDDDDDPFDVTPSAGATDTPSPAPVTETPTPAISPSPTPFTPSPTPPIIVVPTNTPPPPPPPGGYDAACTSRWIALNNDFRTQRGLPALPVHPALAQAASWYASFVLANRWWDNHGPPQVFGGTTVDGIHIDNQGRDHYIRATGYGFPPAIVGENVAWGSLGLTESQLMYDYMLRGAHEPIDLPAWAHMGVACFKDGSVQVAVMVYGANP
jgi:uncharacterized protein YkwD